jgi:hypothetical protein
MLRVAGVYDAEPFEIIQRGQAGDNLNISPITTRLIVMKHPRRTFEPPHIFYSILLSHKTENDNIRHPGHGRKHP